MKSARIEEVADLLWQAQQTGEPCAPPRERSGEGLTLEEAYAVQRRNIGRRCEGGQGLEGKPARRVGRKIGLTSEAIQRWLGVDQPDYGVLLDDMMVSHGHTAPSGRLLQPRAEAELAFVFRQRLVGAQVTAAAVLAACDFVLPAIEIIDSRIADWKISFEDTIADNASSGMFVLGCHPVRLDQIGDLALAGMALRKNGAVVSTGAGVACLRHPVNAVVWLARALAQFGEAIEPGEVILSGALGPVCEIEAGDWLEAEIAHVGSVSVRVG